MSRKEAKRELIGAIGGPGRNGYEIQVFYRIKKGNKARIVTKRIIEPYKTDLEKLPPHKAKEVKKSARKKALEKARKVMNE